jgi:nicotinate-nucleotide pyrophosphorylase (carboxylating)
MSHSREKQLRQALFRGDTLHLENADYLRAVRAFTAELLSADVGPGDITAKALCLASSHHGGSARATAQVLAKTPGIAAGIAEFSWLLAQGGLCVHARKQDGEPIEHGETLLEIEGDRADLLLYERVGLNILQRMSGIATVTHNLQERIRAANSGTFVVGTRKTPWGLLDKRALHFGGGGTHRLGLWDAILVKNNHLALLASREEDAVRIAAQRAWACRGAAAFIEIEVRSQKSAVAAAQTFRTLRDRNREPDGKPDREPGGEPRQPQRPEASPSDTTSNATNNSPSCPCVLMLDNIVPTEVGRIVDVLRTQGLLDYVLLEASGNISENNLEAYAACGVDAVSVGALTHSVQALDLSQRVS